MTEATREEFAATSSTPWACAWIITAPWAHPFWPQYLLEVFDLSTPTGKPPIIHLPGATHELLLHAIDPAAHLEHGVALREQKIARLMPPNCGYQFRAASDAAARDRVQAVVDEILAERLSPDTDYRSRWDAIFSDGFPLVKSGLAEAAQAAGYGRGTEH